MTPVTHPVTSVTLAVLPFENLTEGGALDIFCKSFSIDLVTELSRFRQFQIIAMQSADELPSSPSGEENIESKLVPDYFIQGSFRDQKGQVKVNAQLYESRSRQLVWANRFEGRSAELIDLQEDLLIEVVGSLQQQLNYNLLSQLRKKTKVNLKAYECWLYGFEELKKGTLESDHKAREYFLQAIEIDPAYSLAYSGMSLTYFNEWSCQLWDRWELSQNGSLEWAEKAIELDEQNYVAAYVLGRIFVYQGAYETAEHYLRKSLRLNSNDPESLIQIAICFGYMGFGTEAVALFEKALRLNSAESERYYGIGVTLCFELGEVEKALSLLKKMTKVPFVDSEMYFAAAWFEVGDYEQMDRCLKNFMRTYETQINRGKPATIQEAIEWVRNVNPCRHESKLERFWQHITKGNLTRPRRDVIETSPVRPSENVMTQENGFWLLSFEGQQIQMQSMKGLTDLQKLVANPGEPFHCSELMGSSLVAAGESVIDEKAKRSYRRKIMELQQDIDLAEQNNDFENAAKLKVEYDQLLEHLSSSLGLNQKIRKVGNPMEKARSAVTWRIRSTISKIEKVHPMLGKHLSNAVKTGTFCSYQPEKPISWVI